MKKRKRKSPPKTKPKVGGARMRELGSRRVEVWLNEDEYATVDAVCDLLALKVARFVRDAALAEAHKVHLRHALDQKAAADRKAAS